MTGEPDRSPPCVVLVGPPGAGKSTIGRKLARELGVDLYDTDAGIEEQTGRTIPEIFAEDGEPEFRRIEEQVVRDAVLAGRGIVSLGGGSVLSAATREILRGHTVVYLEISVGEGLRRTGASTNRPLLNGDDPAKKYRELMKIRRPLYREVATVRVRTDGRSPGRVVRMILAKLGLESVVRPEDSATEPTTPTTGAARSRRARRRRGRGGRTDAQKTTATTGSTTAEADSAAAAGPPSAGDPASDAAKPAKRNRRSRRRGRRSGATSASATGVDAMTDSAAAAEITSTVGATHGTGSGTAQATGSGVTSNRRRRRASRATGAPTNPPAPSTNSPSNNAADGAPAALGNSPTMAVAGGSGAGRSRRASGTGSTESGADQSGRSSSDSVGGVQDSAGATPPPGAGRSRRARARRARARARAGTQENPELRAGARHMPEQSVREESEQHL